MNKNICIDLIYRAGYATDKRVCLLYKLQPIHRFDFYRVLEYRSHLAGVLTVLTSIDLYSLVS